MAKKKLTEEQEYEIKTLIATNEMLSKTKEESIGRGKKGAVKQIERAQQEVLDHIKSIDPTALEGAFEAPISASKKDVKQDNLFSDNDIDVFSIEDDVKPIVETQTNEVEKADEIVPKDVTTFDEALFNGVGSDSQFDTIPLPSKGQCYKSKVDRVPVSYLTAYDENIITSPNLYRDGLVIDYL